MTTFMTKMAYSKSKRVELVINKNPLRTVKKHNFY
jgi:hypothetical protein